VRGGLTAIGGDLTILCLQGESFSFAGFSSVFIHLDYRSI
jgi:hypothetical protein